MTADSFNTLFMTARKGGLLGDSGFVSHDCQCYVKNLPADTSDYDLYKMFSPFGAIAPSGTKAMLDDSGACRGFGFVDYMDAISAQAAIESLNGIQGLHVSLKVSNKGDMLRDKSGSYDFFSITKDLDPPGTTFESKQYKWKFGLVDKQNETYCGINVRLRYF